jgi:hypothetical protein
MNGDRMVMPVRQSGLLLAAALLLSACGGGGADAPAQDSVGKRAVTGQIAKGPLVGATVEFFNLDAGGTAVGAPVASAITDDQGRVTAALPASDEPLLAISSGGSYVDESDETTGPGRRRITLAADESFEGIVAPGAESFSMTPYSMALLLRARRLASGANFPIVYEAIVEQAIAAYGFDPTTVQPGDPLAPNLAGDPAAVQYAMLLGGAAYAINAIALNAGVLPTYEIVLTFIQDLSDGKLDGQIEGVPLTVKGKAVDTAIDLSAETQRFLNNNFAAYQDTDLAEIDEDLLSQPPELPDDLPPIANADGIVVPEGGSASVLVSGASSVLANDGNTGGGPLSAVLVTAPTLGTLSLAANGSFLYTRSDSSLAADSFSYLADNGTQQSAPATVSITVVAVNDPPVAAADAYAGSQNTALDVAAPGVLGNDSDPDSPAITAVLISGPAHGTLALGANGGFVYTPQTGFIGADQFVYRASDGSATSADTVVSINVSQSNRAPVGVADAYAVDEDDTLSVPAAEGVLVNDSDPDSNPLTAVLVAGPAHGLLALAPSGAFNYKPNANYNGPDQFTYRASDGAATSAVITVALTVAPVNDPPVAVPDTFTIPEDTYEFSRNVTTNDLNPDGNPLTAILEEGSGNVYVEEDCEEGDVKSIAKWEWEDAAGCLEFDSDGSFTVFPFGGFDGDLYFDYRLSGGDPDNIVTVTIHVTPVNDPPHIYYIPPFSYDPYSSPESWDGPCSMTLPAPGLLDYAYDPDGDTLTVVQESITQVSPLSPVAGIAANGAGYFETYVVPNYSGDMVYSFTVTDGTNTSEPGTITVHFECFSD